MSTKSQALGRGLSALFTGHEDIDPKATAQETAGRIFEIDIDRIHPNPHQPRQDFDQNALESLARSIEQLGIIQPITVRANDDNRFELISGERRLRAARIANLSHIPAFVRIANAEQMLEMALVENVQRVELNPIEIALGYQRLIEECQLTQEVVSQRVGKSRPAIANTLRLLRLPPEIQLALRKQTIQVGHVRPLLSLEKEADQLALFERIQKEGLSARQVEARVRATRPNDRMAKRTVLRRSKTESRSRLDERQVLALRDFESRLRTQLATKVRLVGENSGSGDLQGRIEVHYFSEEELSRLLNKLLTPSA
ncbi:MAG: ParB/RepB/Spo0J family partition protein [Bacteroidota bacterium]|nr:ParB/RepB/Spo0J family partition protein [Bacteroidota bacterium]MDE2834352.1 ParB/RepB/Spo0J family partition protein [Bacteroidota bacterium]MDE2955451.1 ParB/RepB/Spo0J family partition protein [Bacteroidota bacterium]